MTTGTPTNLTDIPVTAPPPTPIPLRARIAERRRQLNLVTTANSAAEKEFQRFLSFLVTSDYDLHLPPTAEDVVDYLVARDLSTSVGITLHSQCCPLFRSRDSTQAPPCTCPTRLTLATSKVIRYRLQAAFRDLGRVGPFNPMSGTGNPAISSEVNRYISALGLEHATAQVIVSSDDRRRLSVSEFHSILDGCRGVYEDHSSPILVRFRSLRDALFFAFSWYILDRGCTVADIRWNQLTFPAILSSPHEGLSIFKANSKTSRTPRDHLQCTTIIPSGDRYCVVRLAILYVQFSTVMGVDVSDAFFLKSVRVRDTVTLPAGVLPTVMVTPCDMRTRLQAICAQLHIPPAALTALRRGRAAALLRDGTPISHVQALGGWATSQMVHRYAGTTPDGPLPL